MGIHEMTEQQLIEYTGSIGYTLLSDLAPLDSSEYGILRDAVVEIERRRLLDRGISESDAIAILGLMDDYFSFSAAASG